MMGMDGRRTVIRAAYGDSWRFPMKDDVLRYALLAVVGVLWATVVAFSLSGGEWLPTIVIVAMTAMWLPARQIVNINRRRRGRRTDWPQGDSAWY